MNIDVAGDYLNGLVGRFNEGLQNRILVAGITTLQGEMIERIFSEGVDSQGGKIGDYSRAPIYVSAEKHIRKNAFQKVGKNNTGDFKNGKPRKSTYYKGGYAEYREAVGRQSGYMDFMLSGSLKNNIQIGEDAGAMVIGLTDEKESLKRLGLEEHVGKPVFTPSASDLQLFEDAIDAEIDLIINELE